jgi:hypothetical protein
MAAPLGNTNAARGNRWRDAIDRALEKRSRARGIQALDELAERLLAAAEEGEGWALKELGDRFDGKPAQGVIVMGDADAAPVQIKATIEFVGREAATSSDDESRRGFEPEHPDSQAT